MENKQKNIGAKPPEASCNDRKCPFHGHLKVSGKSFEGVVIKRPFHKDATVEWARLIYLPKFERYEKRRSTVRVYNPLCIDAVRGDKVKIIQCRPLSKTKHFVIIEKIGKEYLFNVREEAMQESKVKKEEVEEGVEQ